ncbi:MAG: hypothetical protein ABSH45_18040 [Bryobacteraceae bacterium]|jgi:hypothetical protein
MSSDDVSLEVDLAEFNALRAEIQTFLNLQSFFLGLAVAIIAAVIPVAVGQTPGMRPWTFAATPFPLAILATLYADVIARIGRAAGYIQTTLRPRLAKLTAPNDALGWEKYIHRDDPTGRLLLWTDRIRYAVFFLPAIITYLASLWWPVPAGCEWDLFFKTVNLIALLGASIVMWRSEAVIQGIVSNPKD